MGHNFERFCKEPEKIENYEKALKDNFKGWECHHRLETHNSDGERRLVDITKKELIALGMYYNRPAEELIFLTRSEHDAFRKGKHHSEETKEKMREAKKGKHLSEEHKNKIAETLKGNIPWNKGKRLSEETKEKMREAKKGMRWYNNGRINVRAKECPEGFTPGWLR